MFYDSAITELRFGERDIDYDDRAECAAIVKEFTTLYARTDETHDPAMFDADPRGAPQDLRAGSRWARSSISAPSIPNRWARS